MLAVVANALGGPEVLRVTELPEPEAGPGQVLVRIRAVCVHPADLAATTGQIPGGPVPPPFLPGWDIAGEVAATGPGTAEFQVGDRVAGMIPWYRTRGAPAATPSSWRPTPAGWCRCRPSSTSRPRPPCRSTPRPPTRAWPCCRRPAASWSPAPAVASAASSPSWPPSAASTCWPRPAPRTNSGCATSAPTSSSPLHRSGDGRPGGRGVRRGPLGPAAAVEDGGVVVTTRPTPPIDPARGIRQELQLIHLDRDLLADLVAQVAAGRLRTRVAATMPLTEAADAHRRALTGGLHGKLVLTTG
ncbi:alcohol dehydrogenase catalytic domain-containing protein [Paractinoplanes durhamensis]|uniref:alcohol dehydrogenase catalytic domain-containing protein n=1 Tax=Paractinoplanes durhamensis TaxID=113563 RepID=UPI003628AF81